MSDGLLEPMHAHCWRVQARFRNGQLDDRDMLIDFREVEQHLSDILVGFHNRHLNDLPCYGQINPSAENVARGIFESLRDVLDIPELLASVEVWEALDCSAGYGEEPLPSTTAPLGAFRKFGPGS